MRFPWAWRIQRLAAVAAVVFQAVFMECIQMVWNGRIYQNSMVSFTTKSVAKSIFGFRMNCEMTDMISGGVVGITIL
jgi:hypothetical protein